MKITNITQIEDFLAVANECKGAVWLLSPMGDQYNLKSKFSQYIAMARLIEDHSEHLELWCDNHEDEIRFFKFFEKHQEVL